MNKLLFLIASAHLAGQAFAQTNFSEIEPNNQKSQATPVIGITAGDTISGVSTGTSPLNGLDSLDLFRLQTSALPLSLYRHSLTITSAVTNAHGSSLRGLNQAGTPGVGGTAGTQDVFLQSSIPASSAGRFNQWYGFGKQEQVYYRAYGTSTTTPNYTATMSTTTVTPIVIVPEFESASPITFSTYGQTTVDTELMLYDATFTAIPGGVNDDRAGFPGNQSLLTRTLAAGTYYLAVSSGQLSSNQVAPADENFIGGFLTDFADCVVSEASTFASLDLDFQIIGANGTYSRTNPSPANDLFNVMWFQFTVATGASTVATPMCLGDGSGGPCPCANPGALGNGCASSSFPAGARLASSGVAGASNATDTLELIATNIPSTSLFFQTGGFPGAPISFGDGRLCVDSTIRRLGLGVPSAPNTASYPGGGTPIHTVGFTFSGSLYHYQVWYRTVPSLCGAGEYNLSQALRLTWQP